MSAVFSKPKLPAVAKPEMAVQPLIAPTPPRAAETTSASVGNRSNAAVQPLFGNIRREETRPRRQLLGQ